MGEPSYSDLWTPNLGDKIEVSKGLVEEWGWGIFTLGQGKQLVDEGLWKEAEELNILILSLV